MADDRHYVPGDYYQIDDLSSFKIRNSRSRKIPGGQTGNLIVDLKRWEAQQPQDLVRAVVDDQTVPQPRPRQQNQFVVVGTWVTAPSAAQTQFITVDDAVGFQPGSLIQIMLDSGVNFQTLITAITDDTMQLLQPLPATVGTLYGDPIENSVLLLQLSATVGIFVLDSANAILDFNVLG